MKENFRMRAFSVLLAVLLVSVATVPAMACEPLEPGTCPGCSFIKSDGVANDSTTVVSSDELTGDAKNAAIAEALSDTAVRHLKDALLGDGFTLSTEQIRVISGVTTNESMTVTTTLVTTHLTKTASDEKAFLVFASNELGKDARAVVAHDGMVSYLRYDPMGGGQTRDDGVVCDFCMWAVPGVCSGLVSGACAEVCGALCLKPMHPAFIVICAGSCFVLCEFLVAYEACNWNARLACEGAGLC
jgi:hypothetical protein